MHILKSQGILDQLLLPSVVENEGASILVGLFWAPNFTTQVLWISGVRFYQTQKSENPIDQWDQWDFMLSGSCENPAA